MNTKRGTWPLANPPLTTGTIGEQTYMLSTATIFVAYLSGTFSRETMKRSEPQLSQDLDELVEKTVLIYAGKPNT